MQYKKIKKKTKDRDLPRSKKQNAAALNSLIHSHPAYKQMMQEQFEPIPLSGPKAAGPDAVPVDRKVVWKKVCFI